MKNCLNYLNVDLQEYAKILSPKGLPEFLCDYIETRSYAKDKKSWYKLWNTIYRYI